MADTSYGYPGSVDAAALAIWLPNVSAAQYSVDGANDCKVIEGSGDRGITIKPGTIVGDGIMDIFNSNTNLNLASVVAGSRWDMIVCRRTWSTTPGASTSVFTVIQGSATKGLPARNNNKGVLSDQPIALCRVQAGSTEVEEIIDLRCWAHNAGVYAIDELVKGYIDQPGTHLSVGPRNWVKIVNASNVSNSDSWVEAHGMDWINLYDRGSQMRGNPNKAGTKGFQMQAGESLVTTDSNGYGKLIYPTPFSNGVLTVQFQPAEDPRFNDMNVVIPGGDWGAQPSARFSCAFRIYGATNGVRHDNWPNKTVRIAWLAIGY
jgi:hypothetical protein